MHTLPEFSDRLGDNSHWLIAFTGLAFSLTTGWLVWLLGSGRDLARRLASDMTRELRETQTDMEATLDAMPDVLFELDLAGRYHKYRTSRMNLLAAPPETLLGRLIADVLPAPATATCLAALQEAHQNGFSTGRRIEIPLAGEVRWFELSVARKAGSKDRDPQQARFVMISRDITETVVSQLALQATVREKTALLNEVHHRVKNNLQVISSLLRMEGSRSAHATTRAVLTDMQGRIRSMALLHEAVYRDGAFASIELGQYIRQIATQAVRAAQSGAGAIDLHLELDKIQVNLDQAMPCGLIVSELISNCLKHGFPDGRSGQVSITLQSLEHQVQLQVRDTGVGLPADFEERKKSALGLQLAQSLASQLDGSFAAGPGALFTVIFPLAAQA